MDDTQRRFMFEISKWATDGRATGAGALFIARFGAGFERCSAQVFAQVSSD